MLAGRLLPLLAALGAVFVPAALGHAARKPPPGDPVDGKRVFKTQCGRCHTFSSAGTHGKVGPNLGLEELQYSTITWEVTNGNSLMPSFAGTLTHAQIDDVAAFIVDSLYS